MTYNVTKAIQDIEKIIVDLGNPSVEVRREAAAWAQYAFCGNPGRERAALLIDAVGKKLELRVNGHAEPLEPDEYVRERCADSLRLAKEGHYDISPFVPSLRLTAEKDPVDWVRDRAKDALSKADDHVLQAPSVPDEDQLPLPRAWTTRPMPQIQPDKPERAIEKRLRA